MTLQNYYLYVKRCTILHTKDRQILSWWMLRKKGMTWDHIRKRTSHRIGESCNFYLKSEKSLSRTYPFLQSTSGRWRFSRFSGFLEYFLFTLRKLFSLSIAKLPFTSGRLESKGTPPRKPRNCWLLSALNKTDKGKNHINKNVPPTIQTRNKPHLVPCYFALSLVRSFSITRSSFSLPTPKKNHFTAFHVMHSFQWINLSNMQTCLPVLSAFHSTAFPIFWKIHLVSWYHFWNKSKKSSYNICLLYTSPSPRDA